MPISSVWLNAAQMSHPLNNNRVTINKVVNTPEDVVVDEAKTSRVLATRPSLSSSPNLKLDPPLNLPLPAAAAQFL